MPEERPQERPEEPTVGVQDRREEPYIGPRAFERADESLFFGRDHEAEELVSLIVAHPSVLLYAPSGAGKTSLLNARVIPLLKDSAEVLGPARVGVETHAEGPREAVKNVFLFNAFMSIQPGTAAAGTLSGKNLADFLGERRGSEDRDQALPPLRLLLFDQFEEIFTTYPDRWKNREDFFEEVGAALERDRQLRAAFAMREEYLASLDPYLGRFPEMPRRFRLEPLREAPAIEAVRGPVVLFGRSFAPGAAEAIVDTLLHRSANKLDGMAAASSEFVDPLQLQVVCSRLWRALDREVTTIEMEHISGYANVDQALEEYYDDSIRKVVQNTGFSAAAIRTWFQDKLITSENTRGLVFQGQNDAGGLPLGVVRELDDQHLVHAELRAGQRWYELTHDRLIAPILSSNRKWQQEAQLTDSDVVGRIESLAFHRSNARKLRKVIDRPIRALFRYAQRTRSSTLEEDHEDWIHGERIFALEVLEGNVHLRRLDPSSYHRLEMQWLSEVKCTKAYLLWEPDEGSSAPRHADDYYFAACEGFRQALVRSELKAAAERFGPFEKYLTTHYLDAAGKLDPSKKDTDAMLTRKAYRIYEVTGERNPETNWQHACAYARMYYDNILKAVKEHDPESTLAVLEAFQYSRAAENRYLVINCLEAAIAVYFLDPGVIKDLWAREPGQRTLAF
jgi:hypothetical protein